jgi:hypothetical protein
LNAVYESSLARRGVVVVATLAGVTVWALLHVLHLMLLAVLGVCEPIVRVVLSLLSLAGLFTAGLYYFGRSPVLKVSHGILLALSFGCALALAMYEGLLGMLKR